LFGEVKDIKTGEAIQNFDGTIKKGIRVSIVPDFNDSGSPVTNQKGEVVGIMNYVFKERNNVEGNMIPINWFKPYLDSNYQPAAQR